MAQEMYVLPMRCKRCNSVFDLFYDLQQQEEQLKEGMNEVLQAKGLSSQSLCWRCRDEVIGELNENESYTSDEDNLELTLDFE